MADDEEPDEKAFMSSLSAAIISHDSIIGAITFVHIKDSRKLDATVSEGKVCGYSEESKPYKVRTLKTRRVVKSRNVIFIETPPHLIPPSLQLSPLQDLVPPSWDHDGDTLDND